MIPGRIPVRWTSPTKRDATQAGHLQACPEELGGGVTHGGIVLPWVKRELKGPAFVMHRADVVELVDTPS